MLQAIAVERSVRVTFVGGDVSVIFVVVTALYLIWLQLGSPPFRTLTSSYFCSFFFYRSMLEALVAYSARKARTV